MWVLWTNNMERKEINKQIAERLGLSEREVNEVISFQFKKFWEFTKTDAIELEITDLCVLSFSPYRAKHLIINLSNKIKRYIKAIMDGEKKRSIIENMNSELEIMQSKLKKYETVNNIKIVVKSPLKREKESREEGSEEEANYL